MKPVYINNNQSEAYVRFGDSDRKLDQIEINALVRNSSPRIDGHTLRFVSMQDLDETSIQEFKDIVSRRYPVFEYNLMSHEEFLFKIGAIKKSRLDETKGITNGLLLFLGKYNSIKEFFPTFHLDYFYIQGVDDRWSDRVSSDVPNLVEMNLFNFYNIVLSKILVQLPSPFNLNSNLERNERSELDEVIREALVNALAHADYESNQLTIKIQLFSDKIKLENPGSILIGIEPFILGGDSYPRNEIIMKLFRMMGVSERQGFGGYKIFDFAKKNSYKKPCIEQSICKTSITIYFDSNYYLNLLNDVDFLNVYNCIKDFKIPIARREIQAEIEIGEKRLREILNSFMDAGAITKIGAGPTTKYKVNK